jgi:hypothetical protein
MPDQTLLKEIELLVDKLKDEFTDSKYNDCYNPNLDIKESLQLLLSGSSMPEFYNDDLLCMGRTLKDKISLYFVSTIDLNKGVFIKHIIDKLDCKWTVWYDPNKINDKYSCEDAEILNKRFEDFEETKIEAQQIILSELKALSTEHKLFTLKKLKWKGQQIQLAELFANLIEKGWIHNPVDSDKSDPYQSDTEKQSYLAELLNQIFDLRETTKKGSADKTSNLTRHLFYDPKSKYHFSCIKREGVFFEIPNNGLKIK